MTEYTKRRRARQIFAVRVGVYIAIVAGVVAQWAITRFDPKELTLDLRLSAWSISRLFVAMIVAAVVYRSIDGGGDLEGKVKNVGRIVTLGFTSGFTLSGVTGIGG
jgi:hypothetical protein